jgi:hypothetical protein
MPSGEKGTKACSGDSMGHFLRSGFREEGAELPRFPAIIKGTQLDFSATLTLWRRTGVICEEQFPRKAPIFSAPPPCFLSHCCGDYPGHSVKQNRFASIVIAKASIQPALSCRCAGNSRCHVVTNTSTSIRTRLTKPRPRNMCEPLPRRKKRPDVYIKVATIS